MAKLQAKAWVYDSPKGGFAKHLRLADRDVPDHKQDHILVEVLNTSLNPADNKFPNLPVISWRLKRPASPCFDFCGRIRALPRGFTSSDSRDLHVGQIVFGLQWDLKDFGSLKTLMWIHRDSVYPLPDNVPAEHGSGFGISALTAFQAIAPYAKPEGKVLVSGATGGVGTFCIQVAKAFNMHVIATCSDAGVQLCKELGADETLNYKSPSFQEDLCRTRVDLVVDNTGNDPSFHRRSEAFLKPDGHFILVALMDSNWAGTWSMLVSMFCPTWLGGPPRKWKALFMKSKLGDYESVAALARQGKLRVAVDTVFKFEDAPKAFERLDSGRTKGKIIIDVTTPSI